jgi:rsbT antagonist protein RsbS
MLVSILRQRDYLIASIHEALDDEEIVRFQRDLVEQIGQHRAKGIIIDVAALDVLDSFGSRTLANLAHMARLRGAETVIVGIQPAVAFAMVRLGTRLERVHTALDLEEGLEQLAGCCTSTWRGGDQPRSRAVRARLRSDLLALSVRTERAGAPGGLRAGPAGDA